MDLSIVIVNWNTLGLLRRCLQTVYETSGALAVEVWVVDNGSRDGSADMVEREFPSAHLIRNSENAGFARANNQALARASGRYYLLLNSDTETPPGSLAAMVRFMEAHPEVGVAGPELIDANGTSQLSASGRYPGHREQPAISIDQGEAIERCTIFGACMMLRASAVEQVGLLDERFFMFQEDTDWCYRFYLAGWKIAYLPKVKVVHHGGKSTPSALRDRWSFASEMLFYRKHYPLWKVWSFLARRLMQSTVGLTFHTLRLVFGGRKDEVVFACRKHRERVLSIILGARGAN